MHRLLSYRIRNCNCLPVVIKNECGIHNKNTQSSKRNPSYGDDKEGLVEKIVDFDGSDISAKVKKKLTPKSPIVKEFFLGKVDKDLVSFPEVIERDDMAKLNEATQGIRNYFHETLDISSIDKTWCIPAKVMEDIKNLGCFGFNIPKNDGKGYSISESLMASESEIVSADISSVLISHRCVVDVINEFGSESQKQKYLPKLADGSLVATSAIFEATFTEDKLFNTTANHDDVAKDWILNGEKTNVVNGTEANLFLVIAQTRKLEISGEQGIGITLFLVDGSTPGLKRTKEIQSFGMKGSKTCSLSFEKVTLSEENVIGMPDDGNITAQMFLKLARLRTSLQTFGLMKKIIDYMAKFCVEHKQFGVPLQDMDMNGRRLSEAISSAYAVESMIYYTAGLMDEFDKPDVDVECAAIRLFALENLWSTVKSSLEFLGPSSLISGETPEIILRNAAQSYTTGESIESLYSFIGLSGLQYAGTHIFENVKKQRNPLFHPGHMFSKFVEQSTIESPKLNLNLEFELHPSLMPAAKWLEESIGRLQLCTDLVLTRHGTEIIQRQIDINRFAKMAAYIYAMFASLSRSSRSYCIGLRHSDYEMLLATTLCLNGRDIIKNLAKEIESGEFINNDKNYKRLSKQMFKSAGYFPEHPLKYNF